jgi:hypothetical protein
MLSSSGAGGQMTALSDGNKPGSPEKSDINPVPAEGSASADMSKDAGSSASGGGQSTASNTSASGSGSAAGSSASGSSSANDQMAANEASTSASSSGSAAASGGKNWPASYLVGATISNAKDGAEIGDLHFADNKVDKVIINHGGTLGVGEKQMEVAFNDLQISGDPTDPKVELQGESLQQLNAAAEQDKAKKDMSPPSSSQ